MTELQQEIIKMDSREIQQNNPSPVNTLIETQQGDNIQ